MVRSIYTAYVCERRSVRAFGFPGTAGIGLIAVLLLGGFLLADSVLAPVIDSAVK